MGGGLPPGGSTYKGWGGVLPMGSLLPEGWADPSPRIRKVGATRPTRMLSCL